MRGRGKEGDREGETQTDGGKEGERARKRQTDMASVIVDVEVLPLCEIPPFPDHNIFKKKSIIVDQ